MPPQQQLKALRVYLWLGAMAAAAGSALWSATFAALTMLGGAVACAGALPSGGLVFNDVLGSLCCREAFVRGSHLLQGRQLFSELRVLCTA